MHLVGGINLDEVGQAWLWALSDLVCDLFADVILCCFSLYYYCSYCCRLASSLFISLFTILFMMRATSRYFGWVNLRRMACSSERWIKLAN